MSRLPLRVPHVLLHREQVQQAVEDVLTQPTFVFDVETTKEKPRSNSLRWVGIGTAAQNYLIPVDHPLGWTIEKERPVETPAFFYYPEGDPRRFTPTRGDPSYKKIKHTAPATYGRKPDQLFADQVCELIHPLLWSDRAKLGHNLKFDLMSVAKYFGHEIPPGPYHDTIILRHVIDEELRSYSLKDLTCEWFRIPVKERRKFYPNLGDKGVHLFGLDEVARYLAKDLRYCWLMFKHWWDRLMRKDLQPVYDFEMSLYPVIMAMEYAGFPVDTSGMDVVRKDLVSRIAGIEDQAAQLAGGQFPLSNLSHKRWVLFGKVGKNKPEYPVNPENGKVDKHHELRSQNLKPLSFTPEEHLPQVTQAILEHYAERNEMARLLLDWSISEKLRGTFIEGLHRFLHYNNGDLPTLHTSFKQHGTKTGRLSATEPNPQQLPREGGRTSIRNLFVAGPGHVLIVADYDQIELRCAAKESGDRNMLKVFRSGEDIHRSAAAAMFQITNELVTEALRQVGKTQNFAVLYGAGPAKIAFVAKCSIRRAQQLIARYYDQFAGLEPWKEQVLRAARAAGDRGDASHPPYVSIPPIGRLRRLPDLYRYQEDERWRRQRAERQAVNALVQGFASYITKLAMRDLHPKLKEFPAQMILQVHDEIIVRVEERYLDDVLPIVTETMSGVKNQDNDPILGPVPLIVSAKAGYTWALAKGK